MTGSGSGSGSGSPTKSMISRRTSTSASTGWVRCCLISFAVISALCVSAPALYWRFQHSATATATTASSSLTNNAHSCPPCSCHCPPPPSLLQIAPGLANLSVPDCNSSDPDLKKEMAKQFVDLLTEELKLQEGVAAEHTLHMNATLTEARRVASQYQREADKCIAATETCEGAREHSEALLRKEMKLTSLWERRARKMGWEGE